MLNDGAGIAGDDENGAGPFTADEEKGVVVAGYGVLGSGVIGVDTLGGGAE